MIRSSSSDALLKWLCWALAILVIVSAALTIAISQGWLLAHTPYADSADFPTRLAVIRADDAANLTMYWLANFAALGVFFVAMLLGPVLRRYAPAGAPADAMATVIVVGATIGMISELALIAVNQSASFGYCDCGFKTEELIAQNYALDIGFNLQNWLNLGGTTIVGLGAALAGWVLVVSTTWRWLSYAIAAMLFLSVVLQIADMRDAATLLIGVASLGIALWAIMLARAVPRLGRDVRLETA